jgi:hypothetical protein
MPNLVDQFGNQFRGSQDSIGGEVLLDTRAFTALLGALNAEVLIDLNGQSAALLHLKTAALNGTVVFEGTVDNVNYYLITGINILTQSMLQAVVVTTTHDALYMISCTGFKRIRVKISAYSSGNITLAARATRADYAINNIPKPSDLHVTATAAVNTGSTLTLGAAGVGLFHYITKIELIKLYSVVGVAAGAGVIITSTNLPGNPSWTTEQLASPAGSAPRVIDANYPGIPLKSLVANTNTTLVAPAQLQTIWRWNVSYYIGA